MKIFAVSLNFISLSLLAKATLGFDPINSVDLPDNEHREQKETSSIGGQKPFERELGMATGSMFSQIVKKATGTYIYPSSSPSLAPSSSPTSNPTSTVVLQAMQTGDNLQAQSSLCDETLRTMIRVADLNETTTLTTSSGVVIEIPFYDAETGDSLGLWQCTFTNLPHDPTAQPDGKTIHQCSYSFDADNYASQIFVSGTSAGKTNSIIGGSGTYACAGGEEEVYLETEAELKMQMRICSTCS